MDFHGEHTMFYSHPDPDSFLIRYCQDTQISSFTVKQLTNMMVDRFCYRVQHPMEQDFQQLMKIIPLSFTDVPAYFENLHHLQPLCEWTMYFTENLVETLGSMIFDHCTAQEGFISWRKIFLFLWECQRQFIFPFAHCNGNCIPFECGRNLSNAMSNYIHYRISYWIEINGGWLQTLEKDFLLKELTRYTWSNPENLQPVQFNCITPKYYEYDCIHMDYPFLSFNGWIEILIDYFWYGKSNDVLQNCCLQNMEREADCLILNNALNGIHVQKLFLANKMCDWNENMLRAFVNKLAVSVFTGNTFFMTGMKTSWIQGLAFLSLCKYAIQTFCHDSKRECAKEFQRIVQEYFKYKITGSLEYGVWVTALRITRNKVKQQSKKIKVLEELRPKKGLKKEKKPLKNPNEIKEDVEIITKDIKALWTSSS